MSFKGTFSTKLLILFRQEVRCWAVVVMRVTPRCSNISSCESKSQNYVNVLFFFCKPTVFGKKKLPLSSWVCWGSWRGGMKKSGGSLAFFNSGRNQNRYIHKHKYFSFFFSTSCKSLLTCQYQKHSAKCNMSHVPMCILCVCVLYSVIAKLLHVLKLRTAKPS